MGLHEIRIVPSAEVVCDHEARKLVGAKVLVSKEGRVDFMPPEKQTSVDIGCDHNRNIPQVVGA